MVTVEEKEEEVMKEEIQRQVFDPIKGTLDMGKLSANVTSRNAKITLPRAMNNTRESPISLRRQEQEETFKKIVKEKTKDGRQIFNIEFQEDKGLKELQKRKKDGTDAFCMTGKSNKIVVGQLESYLEMGLIHTSKDQEICMGDVTEMALEHDSHMSMFIKMLRMGEAWGHRGRLGESYMGV